MKERMLSSRSENEGRRGRSVGSQVGNKGVRNVPEGATGSFEIV